MKNNVKKNGGLSGRNSHIWKILFCVLAAAATIAIFAACVQVCRRNRAEAEMERLAEDMKGSQSLQTAEAAPGTAETLESSGESVSPEPAGNDIQALNDRGIPIPEKKVDFADLQGNINEDIYAWIYIPDTRIDYPVLQHPTDNTYYLNYNLDGSRGYPGCIYTEDYNTKDFTDPNTVLYGHNMKDGSMFAGLHKYGDREYFDEHPYVYIYTEKGLYVYEIFAAYEYSNEHILYNYDFSDSNVFEKYLENIFAAGDRNSNGSRKDDMTVTADNHILTLSTCIANKPDRRYLVQGVLLNEPAY